METRERNSVSYNNTPQESSITAPLISSPTTMNETPDQRRLPLPQGNHYHGFKLQKQQLEAQTPRKRTPNPDPDPDPARVQPLPLPPAPTARAVDTVVVRYRECLKNHAANMGGHVLDGCGEFMPSGEDDTPEALRCGACECHRSFHRREVEGKSTQSGYYTHHNHMGSSHNPPPRAATVQLPPPQLSPQQRHHHQPMMMAFGGTPDESSSEDQNMFRTNANLMAQTSKKRFRTKFTEEQKEKMHDLAERIGWKIQKQYEQEILQVCNEVGLKRKVFKVWMHNNKQATKKNQQLPPKPHAIWMSTDLMLPTVIEVTTHSNPSNDKRSFMSHFDALTSQVV